MLRYTSTLTPKYSEKLERLMFFNPGQQTALAAIVNSVEMFGSVVVDLFEQHVAADFHYDASLQDVSINDIGVQFIVDRWQE